MKRCGWCSCLKCILKENVIYRVLRFSLFLKHTCGQDGVSRKYSKLQLEKSETEDKIIDPPLIFLYVKQKGKKIYWILFWCTTKFSQLTLQDTPYWKVHWSHQEWTRAGMRCSKENSVADSWHWCWAITASLILHVLGSTLKGKLAQDIVRYCQKFLKLDIKWWEGMVISWDRVNFLHSIFKFMQYFVVHFA